MNEPKLSFQKALLKVEWADKQIDQLEAIYERFKKQNSNLPISKTKVDTNTTALTPHRLQDMPEEVPLLLGDAIRNLRGSLDYCWNGLARKINASGGTLPIGTNKKDVRKSAEKTPVGQAFPNAPGFLADSAGAHADFNDGGNRAICIINRLSNWEKHNLIVLTARKIAMPDLTIGTSPFIGNTVVGGSGFQISTSTGSMPKIQSQGRATTEIVFGEHDFVKDEPIFPLTRNLAQAARQTVQAFIGEFPG